MFRFVLKILIIPLIVFAQVEDLQLEYLSSDDGLSSSIVWSITQDNDGFMWFGTPTGLNKYDGYTFTAYTHNPFDTSGLSDNNITKLLTDHSGYVWIGTYSGGLCRYDPVHDSFLRFRHDPEDSNTISSGSINALCEDKNGNLWVGTTGNGVNVLISDPDSLVPGNTKVIRYYHDAANPNSIVGNFIYDIFVDSKGTIWIATGNGLSGIWLSANGGINVKNYTHDEANPNSLSHNTVTCICEDAYNNMWIGTSDGLNRLDASGQGFKHYRHDPEDEFTLTDNQIDKILTDRNDRTILWIGTFRGGVHKLYIHSGKVIRFEGPSDWPLDLKIFFEDIYQDEAGMFWISSWGKGICKFDPRRNKFSKYLPGFRYGKQETIWGIYQNPNSDQNIIWLISLHGGLLKFDRSKKTYKRFLPESRHPERESKGMLYSLHGEPKPGNPSESVLWLGCYSGGVMQFDTGTETFIYIMDDPDHILSSIRSRISCIYQDPKNHHIMWMGKTAGGLIRYDKKHQVLEKFNPQPGHSSGLSASPVDCIRRDRAGILWIGTWRGGVSRMDEENGTFIHYQHDADDSTSLSHNEVVYMYESRKGVFWIGTGNGLNKFNRQQGTFEHYSEKDGLPGNYIFGIMEDGKGNLWLTTTRGLSRFNPDDGGRAEFKNYDAGDGLHANEFDRKSFFQNMNGEIFAGGHRGFTIFHPDSIKDNPCKPPVQLTQCYIHNKVLTPGKDAVLKKSITHTKELILDHDQNNLSFEFTALDYLNPPKNRYAFKMEGNDREWIYTDASRRFASYTEMSPGAYIFRVKGSNNDGVWNDEGTSLKIIILPPWWNTRLAHIFYFLLFISLLYGSWRLQMNRLRMRHRLEMEHLHAEKLAEVDHMKSRFFANISHEFRTPLTLILGPARSLLETLDSVAEKNDLRIIQRNAIRLQHLVNQLLDLSRLEAGKMELQVQEADIVPVLRKLVLAFTSLAERKRITLKFNCKVKSLIVFMDLDKIEKIMNNLLSNAFKFTPEGGKVEVRVEYTHPPQSPFTKGEAGSPLSRVNPGGCDLSLLSGGKKTVIAREERPKQSPAPPDREGIKGGVRISVTNTGSSIPPDQMDNIFDRFYQVDDSYTRDQEGSGIGLSLVKELVELHHGTISVECRGKGAGCTTTFHVVLPLEQEAYAPEEIIDSPLPTKAGEADESGTAVTPVLAEMDDVMEITPADTSTATRPRILLVEDNPDMRSYIYHNLESAYRVITASNGEQGWQMAVREKPDLVVSDIMMPVMDGYRLCEKLKSNIHTSHIPVILLTARAEMKDKLTGLGLGADDYIPKPFAMEELQMRIKNLIEQRRKLRDRFSREALFGIKDMAFTGQDKHFLERVTERINAHLDDPRFTVQQLGEDIGMSRMNLHLKLKALTNLSPHKFIRLYRLKRAALLLRQKTVSVSEVALEVGFENFSHFAKAFRQQFGESPSHFSSRHRPHPHSE